MKVRLTRKLAEYIDGVDLRGHQTGDLLELPSPDADLLVAERWAVVEQRRDADSTAPKRRATDYPQRAIG
jgi:hypothetical protein